MDVTDALVDKIAHLARLDFPETEKTSMKKDLERMIRFVEKLQELDTTGVPPLLHMSDVINNLREDEVKGSVPREEALKNAARHSDRFFLVPKVIKK
ncbi:Asp-tRNA(Asn)/Glu-tRNA(Gln) amidotransferase subunit GatC [Dinghuibacter silviterrae]|uniref:Aspartyl/glutamyl-tRNA(Asn/Gln) amidotransferase subunit C n=1 Tax=Dinghuibacter silviterrae TaxID=1539049 RepID=A0A4V3GLQ0_9BACT|nr:Asp-tRNA(Asn)/Glu-tRNA(Gln) amidotransferase subunit GatC [Dinghuibacter silviterrae]TDX00423.1 aspartyl/glutamyl-tRNA(Asn/Gln) amidotransferase subunit C [Dinghuibacter silviterrae]